MDFVSPAIAELLKQGTGYVLTILVGLYAWMLDKRVQKRDDDADEVAKISNAEMKEMYEKRLNEFRELLDVMTNSTRTVTAMHSSLTASTEAINQLAVGFTTLLNEFHAQQARWDDRRGAMAKQLDSIEQALRELQRNSGRAA